jgi:hypothetical protein
MKGISVDVNKKDHEINEKQLKRMWKLVEQEND